MINDTCRSFNDLSLLLDRTRQIIFDNDGDFLTAMGCRFNATELTYCYITHDITRIQYLLLPNVRKNVILNTSDVLQWVNSINNPNNTGQ